MEASLRQTEPDKYRSWLVDITSTREDIHSSEVMPQLDFLVCYRRMQCIVSLDIGSLKTIPMMKCI